MIIKKNEEYSKISFNINLIKTNNNNKNNFIIKQIKEKNSYYYNNYIFNKNKFIILLFVILAFLLLNNSNLYKKYKKYFIPNTIRLAFVFGTRPEALKLFPLIKELKKIKRFICIIINTGQHKEMLEKIFDVLNMDNYIDYNLNIMKKNQSLSKLTSKIIYELEKIYNLIIPNAVIVQGDTTTGFSAALSAFYNKIPIFHVEAGLRTHNLYSPFPEEFNRLSIDDISTLYFSPTVLTANNLLKENKNSSNIFVTGNTIVDTLKIAIKTTSPSKNVINLIQKAKLQCTSEKECKIILLTCHRRENYFKPIYNIIRAVQKLLIDFNSIIIIFPFHLNPNIKQSIQNVIPNNIYDDIIKGKIIEEKNYSYLNRFLMIPPLNYYDLIHLEIESYFIMTDSGGIQEEAVSIGKPLLILRKNTERPEAVLAGSAFITGTSCNKIYNLASSLLKNKDLYKNMSKSQKIYGNGNSSIIISNIIQHYFNNKINNSNSLIKKNYNDILIQYDKNILKVGDSINKFDENIIYDLVIVLTVWRRNNLERQLIQIKNQSILKNKKTNIIIFQNSNHVNISHIVNKWNNSINFSSKVDITFIQSPIETGYFGRFIIPLTSSVTGKSYFIICDDDMIWGNRYFENMLRVVNEGYLCTRNGRIIQDDYRETSGVYQNVTFLKKQICYNEDIEYDFGGHIWAGYISWLRKAWNHIPISFENSEDFWISATLKSFYNISTKIPKCPCPEKKNLVPDMCAVSDKSAAYHKNAQFGKSIISHGIRKRLMERIIKKYNYKRLILSKPEYVKNIYKKFVYGDNLFNLSDFMWKDALFWQ